MAGDRDRRPRLQSSEFRQRDHHQTLTSICGFGRQLIPTDGSLPKLGCRERSVPDELYQIGTLRLQGYKLIEMQGWHESRVPDELYQIGTSRIQGYKLIEMRGWRERSVPDELYQIGMLRL
uniref:Uncharacterized protein n=1 Tax=Oryza nivara TaxID=4536 RepID=A0A0E0IM52_ORYNI